MDEILSKLPPYITDYSSPGDWAWLTVSSMDKGELKWQACYMGLDGYALNGFHTFGCTPAEALLKLKETIDLLQLLESPAGIAESIDGS